MYSVRSSQAVIGGAGTAGTGACPKLGITLFPLSPTDGLNPGSDGLTRLPFWFYPHLPPPPPQSTISSSRPIVESPPLISCEHDCSIPLRTLPYLTSRGLNFSNFLQQPPLPAAVRSSPLKVAYSRLSTRQSHSHSWVGDSSSPSLACDFFTSLQQPRQTSLLQHKHLSLSRITSELSVLPSRNPSEQSS